MVSLYSIPQTPMRHNRTNSASSASSASSVMTAASTPQASPSGNPSVVSPTNAPSVPHSPTKTSASTNTGSSPSSPVSAQATIAQLQDRWSETVSPSLSSRLGQWVGGRGAASEPLEADPPMPPPPPKKTSPKKRHHRRTGSAADRTLARQQALFQQRNVRYRGAVEQIQNKVHQVVIDDAILQELQQQLRTEGAVTNSGLSQTIHARLLHIHKNQILQQQQLAEQLQAMNQANQEALMLGKTGAVPTGTKAKHVMNLHSMATKHQRQHTPTTPTISEEKEVVANNHTDPAEPVAPDAAAVAFSAWYSNAQQV